jgi:PTS system mannitol-specific IIC component
MVEGKIKTGFEMLVDNFSAGILGALLAILAFLGIGPVVDAVSAALASGVERLVGAGLLPLASLFIEPGKVLFLNNAINHGVLTPIAVEQARQYGSSVLFLLEANPGPGLGILLAYSFFGKGNAKKSAPGAAIIHFFGGIHEIYFPYILMKPLLFIATIVAGMSGIFTLVTLKGGLVGPASPGSFIAMLAVTPKSFGSFAANIAAVCVATIVSFAIGSLILKTDKAGNENLEEATRKMESMKGKKSRVSGVLTDSKTLDPQAVKKIVFACDAGMGSSAMGASLLRKKVKAAGLAINVTNTAVSSIPSDAQIVVTQSELTPRAKEKAPDAYHVSVDNFLSSPSYDLLINQLSRGEKAVPEAAEESSVAPFVDGDILRKENVFINQSFKSKEEVIRFAGQKLVEGGYVKPSYVEGMIARDQLMSTYMGNGIAIPHGTEEVKKEVLASGIVIIQIPESVDFNGNKVRLVFGIAGKNNSHLEILSKIAVACSDVINVGEMVRAQSVDELIMVINHAVAQNA